MSTSAISPITVRVLVAATPERAWACLTDPVHVVGWNFAAPTWHCPRATADLRVGGTFSHRMEARDGSMGFDFWGTYTVVEAPTRLEYLLGDGRTVRVRLTAEAEGTRVEETFDPEAVNPRELQEGGWQAILDNLKRYAEAG